MSMSHLLRCLALTAVALFCAFGPASEARSQDAPADLSSRIERLKTMTPKERARLKKALQRFRKLDAAQRKALREKAKKIGEDRLRALGGRDIEPLQARHLRVREEVKGLKDLLKFDHATRALSEAEKQYMEHELARRFHQAVRGQILAPHGEPFDLKAFQAKTPAERKAFYRDRLNVWMLEQMDEAERERFRVAKPREQAKMRRRILTDFRDRYALTYVRTFQAGFLTKFQQLPQDKRDRQVRNFQRRARWFEMSRLLERDVQVAPEVLRRLRQLPATDWRRVRDRYEALREEPAHRRRLQLETLIDELHGKAAIDRQRRIQKRK